MAPQNPKQAAKAAGLTYANDDAPGIARKGKPGHFHYSDAHGKHVNKKTLARIRKLAIPPAWTDVWIAPSPNAHLQATGQDARGRKQYRYHPDFAAIRDAHKFSHLVEFAAALPAIRRRLKAEEKKPGLPRGKVIAAAVALLEESLIRVGNEDYAKANDSFGLTTLRNRHVKVRGAEIQFLFKGKSGKEWKLSVKDPKVAKIIRRCQDLPGQHLLEYRDDEGKVHAITSSDVNDWLREASGKDITAKDFRTWAGTVEAARLFHAARDVERPVTRKAVKDAIAAVADELGNTVAVCRKCYIHPAIVDGFIDGHLDLRIPKKGRGGLSAMECAVAALLKRAA
jgi:DNA topoisomerase-1